MNSGAGSGEYSSTSTSPSRPASDAIAAASASGSRMSAAAPAAVIPSPSSSAARPSSLRLRAGHEPDGEPLAPEAPGDGHAEVRPGPDDHDRHAPQPSHAGSGRMPRMEEGKRVSWVELYLDLVFVLAVAQIAHLIVAEPRDAQRLDRPRAVLHALVDLGRVRGALQPLRRGRAPPARPVPRREHPGGRRGGRDRAGLRRRQHRVRAQPRRDAARDRHRARPRRREAADAADHPRVPLLGAAVPGVDLGAGAVPVRALGDRDLHGVRRDARRGPLARRAG